MRPSFERIRYRLSTFPDLADLPYSALSVGMLDLPSPNAFADEIDDGCCLGIHTGLLISVAETAALLRDALGAFSDDRSGRKFGESEPEGMPIGVRAFLSIRNSGIFDDALLGEARTDDLVNRRGIFFISCALQFAMLHEFGHIVHGHLKWLAERRSTPSLREIDGSGYDGREKWIDVLRFFEHESDIWALQILIETAAAGQNVGIVAGVPADEWLPLLLLAFLTTILVWSELENVFGRAANSRHPGALERQAAMTLAIINVLDSRPEAERLVAEGLRRAQQIVHALGVRHARFRILSSMFESPAIGEADAVRTSMEKMASLIAADRV